MRRLSVVLLVLAIAVAGVAAGCGGSDEAEEEPTTPAEAVTEIDEIKTMLQNSVHQVRSGDPAEAEATVGDAYLEHFEHVEGPLDKVDHELNETLEDSIREELRDKIKAKASAAEIAALKREIDANLDKAEAALR